MSEPSRRRLSLIWKPTRSFEMAPQYGAAFSENRLTAIRPLAADQIYIRCGASFRLVLGVKQTSRQRPAVEIDPGRVKTLRGITAPGILRLVVTLRAKKCKNSSAAQRYNQIRFRFHTAWAHRDRPPFSGRPSLTGHCGLGWTCNLPRPVVHSPRRTSSSR